MVGKLAVVMDDHVGVDDNLRSYVLRPGDSGLVIYKEYQSQTVGLLMYGQIVYVEMKSVKYLED